MADTMPASSPLSSPPSHFCRRSSSPLSSLGSTPEPPEIMLQQTCARRPEENYPSPVSSQQSSQTSSPTPDGMESSDKDGPPPAKRRRISREPRERTTEYLDLRSGEVDPEQQEELARLMNILHRRQKVVVIAGAGMSVSAGKNGLFRTLKEEYSLKGRGQDLFDASVYKDDHSTSLFHSMVSNMSRMTKAAKPTAFHHMLATMAKEGRLLRLYTQNVDGLDTCLDPLQTRIPLTKDQDGKWPRTVQLHGGLEKMVCSKCHEISEFNPELFNGAIPPLCPRCEEVNDIRTNHEGKRSHGVGCLRPRMVLYNEHNPDELAIGSVMKEDLRRRPDAVIVVGTTVKIPGVKRILKELSGIVRDRKDGGLAIWINQELPPAADGIKDCFDIIVQSSCDEVASRAAMRKWNEPCEQDDFNEVSDEEAMKAAGRKAAVVLPTNVPKPQCDLTEANLVKLASTNHWNNSFPPPSDGEKRPGRVDVSPSDWSPISSRRTSAILPSIEPPEKAGDNITVNTGLLTPTKSQKSRSRGSTPTKKVASINDKLKDAGNSKAQKPAAKGSKAKAAAQPAKKKTVKYIKPATSAAKSKTSTQKGKAKGAQVSQNSTITTNFTQTKTASVVAKSEAAKKGLQSPSKLRQPGRLSSFLWTIGGSLLHSGVVINGREYAYGGHNKRGITGVYWTRPHFEPPGGTWRCTILQGFTLRTAPEIDAIVREVSEQFLGVNYNLLTNNCNHFTNALCERLTGRSAPAWVNRAASVGLALPCMVPKEWIAPPDHETAEGELMEEEIEEDEEEDERAAMLVSDRRRRAKEHQQQQRRKRQDSEASRKTDVSETTISERPWDEEVQAEEIGTSLAGGSRIPDLSGTPPPRLVSVRDTSGRDMPVAERAPVPKRTMSSS
ncbi:DHS-like NAD/FAD-binding domain-containing protein [Hortaea werneckii]|nr:DHS-like NAD/FAD-binding domain-containing protein [Hortaea werneckii]